MSWGVDLGVATFLAGAVNALRQPVVKDALEDAPEDALEDALEDELEDASGGRASSGCSALAFRSTLLFFLPGREIRRPCNSKHQ
jgi:hypothetical protein